MPAFRSALGASSCTRPFRASGFVIFRPPGMVRFCSQIWFVRPEECLEKHFPCKFAVGIRVRLIWKKRGEALGFTWRGVIPSAPAVAVLWKRGGCHYWGEIKACPDCITQELSARRLFLLTLSLANRTGLRLKMALLLKLSFRCDATCSDFSFVHLGEAQGL